MEDALATIEGLSEQHATQGKALFDACKGQMYPMDVLSLTVLNRSLGLIMGFALLMRNGGYIAAAGLLRMQLDNVLRFHGILNSAADPHEVANQVLNGVALSSINGANKQPMKDAELRRLLSSQNPWVDHVYKLSSGYIHLSEQHSLHLLQRSPRNSDGHREIAIGGEDDYLSGEQRLDLVNTFAVVSRAVLKVAHLWTSQRESYGTQTELSSKYKTAV